MDIKGSYVYVFSKFSSNTSFYVLYNNISIQTLKVEYSAYIFMY